MLNSQIYKSLVYESFSQSRSMKNICWSVIIPTDPFYCACLIYGTFSPQLQSSYQYRFTQSHSCFRHPKAQRSSLSTIGRFTRDWFLSTSDFQPPLHSQSLSEAVGSTTEPLSCWYLSLLENRPLCCFISLERKRRCWKPLLERTSSLQKRESAPATSNN